MDIIVSRLRLAGTAPIYQYRALVPLYGVGPARRPRCVVLQATLGNGRVPSTRLADVIAPDSWFERHLAIPCGLAARLTFVARRIEALIIRTVYPEMTAELPPLMFALDHDPGDARFCVTTADLNGIFDRVSPDIETLMAADLGLHQGCDRRAA